MSIDNIKDIIETTLKAEIVKALNSAPDAIEKLVTAAIAIEVDKYTGSEKTDYYSKKVPYLDYLLGQEIRSAARSAVSEVFATRGDEIKAAIKRKFTTDAVIDGFAKALIDTGQQDWRVNVTFEGEKK